ncbi:MAG: hypothetical protein P9M14_10530 [Candidatus Alcyoniella australis]|nr:hypothetical protein [Candidatus Alcyoniella australis]
MRTALVALLALLLCCAGCAGKSAAQQSADDAAIAANIAVEQSAAQYTPLSAEERAMLDAFRAEAEELIYEQMQMGWRARVFGEPVDFASTYAGHDALFSEATVELARRAIATETDPETARALEYFRVYLLSEIISKRTVQIDDHVTNGQIEAVITVDGEQFAYFEYSRLLRNEVDYDRRGRISNAVLPVYAQLEPLLLEKERVARELAQRLGYAGYVELSGDLRDADLELLAVRCESFLTETDYLYIDLLRRVSPKQMGFPAEHLRRCDIGRLLQNAKYEHYFPVEQMMPLMRRTLLGMGIDLLAMSNVTVDDEAREKKNPRAACYPMRVPQDVRLTIKPAGGDSDYKTLFHEMGHTQHYAWTTAKRFEFQQLGPYTVTETYAFLFDSLFEYPYFVRDELGITGADLAHYLQFAAFEKLMMARRYAAKVIYEVELHRGVDNPQLRYRELLGRAYGIELDAGDGERYMIDLDDYFYSADYLRAWWLEAMLGQRLRERFGDKWYRSPEAGAYLQSLWSSGNRMSGEELARELGYERIDPAALLDKLGWVLSFRELDPPPAQ